MSNFTDKATVSLFVNGEQAERTMDKLNKQLKDYRAELQKAYDAGDTKNYAKLEKQIARTQKQLSQMTSVSKGVGIVLNDLSNTSITGLRNTLNYLQKELRATKPNTKTWHDLAGKIDLVKGRLDALNQSLRGSESLWSKFKSWATGAWPAIDLISKGYDALISNMREYVDAFAEMDQEMANVRKFTGMTESQVDSLNEEFKKIDTRTPRENLNKLAQEAGRLGKTSDKDVLGFVRAADKINVALDDLGEGATLTLSKLTGVFGDEERYGTEQSLLKVGSVINELSQNCRASAPYLANFTERMGGVGKQANMTIQQIMGYGAVLDSNSQKVEASATALSQIIVRMYQDPAKYAKVAGLEVKSFTKLMREDANAALLLFLETLQKAGGMDVLSPMFKDMEENGSRAITALSTLATHIDEVKAQQDAANIAFAEGTSIDKEFAVQNNTVQASLDKAKKRFQELRVELGEKLAPLMMHLLSSTSAMAKAVNILIDFALEHKKAITVLTVATAAYIVVLKSEIIAKKARNAIDTIHYGYLVLEARATQTLAVVTEGLRLVYYKYTGQVGKAIVAQRAFNAAMASTPWGAILTAVAAAVVSFKMLGDATEKQTITLETLNKGKADAAVKLKEERTLLEQNIKTLQNFNGSKDQERTLLENLNSKYGGFFGTCKTLKEWYDTLTKRGDDYCNSIYRQILMEAKRQQALDLAKKAADAREKGLDGVGPDGKGISFGDKLDEFVYNLKYLPSGDHLSWSEAANEVYYRNKKYWDDYADALESRADLMMREYAAEVAEQAPFQTTTITNPDYTPYVSQKDSDKAKRKSELEAKRELAKANAAYKAAMEKAKGDWEAESADNVVSYATGAKTYQDYIDEKERLDLKYVNDRIEIYNNLYQDETKENKALLLKYDEDYQALLLKKAEYDKKFSDAASSRNIASLKKEYEQRLAMTKAEFNTPGNPLYQNESAQQEALFQLKIDYLAKYRDSYKTNSKEWSEYEAQIQTAEQERLLEKRNRMNELIAKWRGSKESSVIEATHRMELNLLEYAYKRKKITEKEFQEWKARMEAEYERKKEKKSYEVSITDSNGGQVTVDTRTPSERKADDYTGPQSKRDQTIDALSGLYESGVISEEEYNNRCANARRQANKEMLALATDGMDAQTKMLFELGEAWYSFFDSLIANGSFSFDNIEDMARTTVAALCAGLEVYSQFAQAQARIDIANTEKKYDSMIEAAQGNSYKTKKLEKEKEQRVAKIKADASRKEFNVKVIEAMAQTAQNALMAYGSLVGIPVVGPALAAAAAATATAMGLVQVALIKKQQKAARAEGYAEGGFTPKGPKYKEVGVVHAGEWVASQRLLANPVARPMIEALDYAQRTNTIGSLRPDDVSRSITANNTLARVAERDGGYALMVAAAAQMSRTVSDLTDRLNEPFVTVNTVTGDHGIKKAQDEYSRLMNNITPKSKRK